MISASQWTEPAIPAPTNTSFAYARIGGSDRNLAADWATANPTVGIPNPNLTTPFPGPVQVIVSPSVSGNFVDGSWTGIVTIQQTAIGMRLRAVDGAGHIGDSNLLNVIIPTPAVSIVSVTDISGTTATLTAVINPNGNATSARFQCGTTTSYGTDLPVTLLPNDGFGDQPVSVTIGGLSPGTTHHLRLTAPNAGGTANTTDVTFTTISNDPMLSKLAITPGIVAPAFSANTTTYSASVPTATSSITMTATTVNENASAQSRVNDGAFGPLENPLTLNVGTNSVDVLVTAQDGVTTRTYTTLVTRRTLYEDWAANSGLSGPNSAHTADFDRDGTANLLEWAFGTNPAAASPRSLAANGGAILRRGGPATLSIGNGSGGFTRVAAFARRVDYASTGLTYTVEFSSNLASWIPTTAEPNVIATDGEIEIVTVPYPPPGSGAHADFFHVVVTAP